MTPIGRSKPAKRASRKPQRPKSGAKKKTPTRSAVKRQATPRKPARPARKAVRATAAKVKPAAVKVKPAAAKVKPAAKTRPAAAKAGPVGDPAVELYELAIRAMFAQRWSEAARLFRRVVDGRDGAEADLQERALQQLHICEDKLGGDRDGAAEDPFLVAVVHKNAGEYEAALAVCSRGGRQSKDERFAYLAASIHALRDEGEDAARFLELAIDLNPKNRVHAFHDPDFQTLRASGALERLFRG